MHTHNHIRAYKYLRSESQNPSTDYQIAQLSPEFGNNRNVFNEHWTSVSITRFDVSSCMTIEAQNSTLSMLEYSAEIMYAHNDQIRIAGVPYDKEGHKHVLPLK